MNANEQVSQKQSAADSLSRREKLELWRQQKKPPVASSKKTQELSVKNDFQEKLLVVKRSPLQSKENLPQSDSGMKTEQVSWKFPPQKSQSSTQSLKPSAADVNRPSESSNEQQLVIAKLKKQLKHLHSDALKKDQEIKRVENQMEELKLKLSQYETQPSDSVSCNIHDTVNDISHTQEDLRKIIREKDEQLKEKDELLAQFAADYIPKSRFDELQQDYLELQNDRDDYEQLVLELEKQLTINEEETTAAANQKIRLDDLEAQLETAEATLHAVRYKLTSVEENRDQLEDALEETLSENKLLHEKLQIISLSLLTADDSLVDENLSAEKSDASVQTGLYSVSVACQAIDTTERDWKTLCAANDVMFQQMEEQQEKFQKDIQRERCTADYWQEAAKRSLEVSHSLKKQVEQLTMRVTKLDDALRAEKNLNLRLSKQCEEMMGLLDASSE